jgi:hypothetical protein
MGCFWRQAGEVRPGSGKMAKERHRAHGQKVKRHKTDRINWQRSMIFVKKFAGKYYRGSLS